MAAAPLVLDTNIVLDVFVFADPAAVPVREGLVVGRLDWIATSPMRVELERVLGYPQIVPRLAFYGLAASDVLDCFDRHARLVEVAPRIGFSCKDPDDQPFIDLAAAHCAQLLSKDRAVLCMRKRLAGLGVVVGTTFDDPAVNPQKLLPARR
ncbi:PIN domain-containing protein [Xylophilus sp. GOD-11R]|uniref:PIN domain-containing protein n=1 Tax=Xylophilus sp. GOD-11R TaxID=3089814 RepID=UPI00298D4E1B|nr:PIN domain-containing protein [Xylophilus sp. GOD-11R]WPB57241.1 PIN domain-containing protein [Xylophilus sp. GOD-11R]